MGTGVKLMRGVLKLLSLQPLKVHYFWSGLFKSVMKLTRYRRDVVMTNLSRSFPEKKYKEISALADRFYSNLADILVEAVFFCRGNNEVLRASHLVEMDNPQLLNEMFESCPGVVLLDSHCGNWELTGGVLNYYYSDVPASFNEQTFTVVYKKVSSPFWGKIMEDVRCAQISDRDNCYVESRNILRYMLGRKGERHIYVFPNDQAPYRGARPHPIGKFMNQETMSMEGGVNVAVKMGFGVAYMNLDRESRGHYRWRVEKICDDASTFTPDEITRRYYDLLEADIRRNPSNYLWSHKRWKA